MPPDSTSRATIKDVAQRAGVSISTVSRVVSGSTSVDPALAEKVRASVKELHYRPHAFASKLKSKKTFMIGLLLPEIGGAYFAEILRAIEDQVTQNGYSLLIYSTQGRNVHTMGAELPLGNDNTDGLLVFADSIGDADLYRLHSQGLPLVLLHRSPPPGVAVPMVTVENKAGACNLVEHLIDRHACRRIGFLAGPAEHEDSYWREQGYRKALLEHGLAVDPGLMRLGAFDERVAEAAVGEWLAAGTEIDAICAGDDTSAIGAIKALHAAGKAVPGDIPVVGFDDLPLSRYLTPALTTVGAPIAEAGRVAVEQLLHVMRSEPAEAVTLLPTRVVIRQSCGCP